MILNEVASWGDPLLSLSDATMGAMSDGSYNGGSKQWKLQSGLRAMGELVKMEM